MSKREGHDRGALAALALILGAVVLLAGAELWARYTFDQQIEQPQQQGQNDGPGNVRPAEPNPWPQFTPSDTYAQWVMAALAGVATAVSIVGVIWIRQTLEEARRTANAAVHGTIQSARAAIAASNSADEARRANDIAQDMGQKQVMAYLSCIEAKFGVTAKSAWITLTLRNHGQSPARWARVTGTAVIPNLAGNLPPLTYHTIGIGETGPIITATSENALLTTGNVADFSTDALDRAVRYRFPFMCDCILEWEDVFGHIETLRFTLIEDMERSTFQDLPDAPSGVKKGWMIPSSSRHYPGQQQPEA